MKHLKLLLFFVTLFMLTRLVAGDNPKKYYVSIVTSDITDRYKYLDYSIASITDSTITIYKTIIDETDTIMGPITLNARQIILIKTKRKKGGIPAYISIPIPIVAGFLLGGILGNIKDEQTVLSHSKIFGDIHPVAATITGTIVGIVCGGFIGLLINAQLGIIHKYRINMNPDNFITFKKTFD